MRAAGAEKVFPETASDAQTNRAHLRRSLDRLAKGDVLMVTRLDRLARSTRDLLNTLAAITGKVAGFRSIGMEKQSIKRGPKRMTEKRLAANRRNASMAGRPAGSMNAEKIAFRDRDAGSQDTALTHCEIATVAKLA